MTQYYIILAIETNGLPYDWDAPVQYIDNWPEIIEIAWQLFDDERNLINERSLIVKPNDCEISEEIEVLTGITLENIHKNGIPPPIAFKELSKALQTFSPILVSHNCEFVTKVIAANCLRYDLNYSILFDEQVCTMKESIYFCELPNLKYPKLSELSEALFSEKTENSHIALFDVQVIARAFFKLQDIGVILPQKRTPISPPDLENLTVDQIQIAISNYISDLNIYPIFYDIENISTLFGNRIFNQIKDRYNKYYQTIKSRLFEIPYNQVVNRVVISLNVEDIIIRYIIFNHLKEQTNFVSSIDKYTEETLDKLFKKEIEKGNSILVKIDIDNCFESINHEKLIAEVLKELQIDEESTYIKVFTNALKVLYETDGSGIKKKKQGLLIGSKPDEYFAEFYLDKIEKAIRSKDRIPVIRIADEFIYFSNNFSSARDVFKKIEKTIFELGLNINRGKTEIKDFRKDALKQKIDMELVDALWSGVSFPFRIQPETFVLRRIDERTVLNKKYLEGEDEQMKHYDKKNSGQEEIKSESNSDISSYEDAILFIKQLLDSRSTITNYQENHPEYRYFYNIVFSQPTNFREDYYDVNFSLFSEDSILKLKKIIYYYPKSEYYSALALQLLVFAAINTVHCTNVDMHVDYLSYNLTKTCELANLTILEILDSDDIHEYQKYILLRCLFKKNNDLGIDLECYSIKTVNFYDYDYLDENAEFRFNPVLPFKTEILKTVNRLESETNYYPLKMICHELNRLASPPAQALL